LEYNKAIPVEIFPKIGYHAPNIEKLVLKGTDITDAILEEIAQSCPKYLQPLTSGSIISIFQSAIRSPAKESKHS